MLLVVLLLMSGFAYSATDSEVGSWLKNHEEDGYTHGVISHKNLENVQKLITDLHLSIPRFLLP